MKQVFYFLFIKETLSSNEQGRLFHKNRWEESDIAEKYYQTTWRLVYVSMRRWVQSSITLGVLGLCAIVLSSPYDIPTYVPNALMLLCEHSHDPDVIQVFILDSDFL
jgi:hypothetical protein